MAKSISTPDKHPYRQRTIRGKQYLQRKQGNKWHTVAVIPTMAIKPADHNPLRIKLKKLITQLECILNELTP